jgi:hypothetical protein
MKKIIGLVLGLLLVSVPCFAAAPLQTSTSIAVAAPFFIDGGSAWGNAANGGWSVGAGAELGVTAYAQGTKSAQTTAIANGTAFGIGGAIGIQTPHFGIGTSGALAGVYVLGAGYGLGIDKFSLFTNPDFASVGIKYQGGVVQSNGILVSNGNGTYAGGQNETGAIFCGSSYTEDLKFGGLGGKVFDILTPAVAVGADGAGALAGGYTIGGYIDTPNFAAAGAKTVGFSGYIADQGAVAGTGQANHQAVVNNGSFGLSGGNATFSYAGTGSLGYGSAQTGGYTAIHNTGSSSTVTSFSSGSARATVK